ncbi:MAG TPA: hypothetical protein VI916_02040 [Acidimicrobiia bacterium]|nr:hypothetical protein [Acidimicrobiia bacterium]
MSGNAAFGGGGMHNRGIAVALGVDFSGNTPNNCDGRVVVGCAV